MQITQVMAMGAARAQTSQLSFSLWERLHPLPPSYLAARLRRKGSHAYLTLQHHCCFSVPHHPWIKSFTGTLHKLRNCRVLKHVSLYFIVVSKTSWIDYARDTGSLVAQVSVKSKVLTRSIYQEDEPLGCNLTAHT